MMSAVVQFILGNVFVKITTLTSRNVQMLASKSRGEILHNLKFVVSFGVDFVLARNKASTDYILRRQ